MTTPSLLFSLDGQIRIQSGRTACSELFDCVFCFSVAICTLVLVIILHLFSLYFCKFYCDHIYTHLVAKAVAQDVYLYNTCLVYLAFGKETFC